MNNKPFQIYRVDPGFCRIIYRGKNRHNQNIYYGLYQEAPQSFRLYRVCPQLEAQNIAYPRVPLINLLEIPVGDTQLEKDVATYLLSTY